MTFATMSTADLLAEKAALEAERTAFAANLKKRAAPLNAEQVRRAIETNVVARLRNNIRPTPVELAHLRSLPDGRIAGLEAEAIASAAACRAKNPAWQPKLSQRDFDLMDLVRTARK